MATQLKSFSGSQFEGKVVLADIEFIPFLEEMNQLAATRGIMIFITSSARLSGQVISGAIVPPASRSNHLIGHAIDMNIREGSNFFNGNALANLNSLPSSVRGFLQAINQHPILRWGGSFNDPVHIDNPLNLSDSLPSGVTATYDQKFSIIQRELREMQGIGTGSGGNRELFVTRPLMQGNDVLEVQQKLVEEGFSIVPDGIFGPATELAVNQFQTREGLIADGIVGRHTKEKLGL